MQSFRDEKLQYNINKDFVKSSALLSRKIDKCEYLTGEGMLLPDQIRMIKKS